MRRKIIIISSVCLFLIIYCIVILYIKNHNTTYTNIFAIKPCIPSETFLSGAYSGIDYLTFRDQVLWNWKMEKFDRDNIDSPMVDVSEDAIASVPTEKEIWKQFLISNSIIEENIVETSVIETPFCITYTGKQPLGNAYPHFRAEELLYWQVKPYHGSTPDTWDVLQEWQLKQMFLDSHFVLRLNNQRGEYFY